MAMDEPSRTSNVPKVKQMHVVFHACSVMIDVTCSDFDVQTPLAEIRIHLMLNWRKGKTMPSGMAGSIQSVVIGNNVYVGGGYKHSLGAIVMVYSLQTGSWRTPPRYETKCFGMAAVNNQLVTVGGRSLSRSTSTNVLGVWDERSQTWRHPFPMMQTERVIPSVISYQHWLVVAVGVDERSCDLKTVELLDTLSGQWYEGSTLPQGCSGISSAINGNM